MIRLISFFCVLLASAVMSSAQFTETAPVSLRTVVIGCIGDSITQGVGTSAQVPACAQMPKFLNKLHGVTSIYSSVNAGVSGSTTADWSPGGSLLRGAIAAMTVANVNVVQIMLGTNDSKVAVATSQSAYSTNLQAIITALTGAGFKKIVLHQPIYISQPEGQWDVITSNSLIQQYGDAITALAAANSGRVFDGDHFGYAWFHDNPSDSADGIHPNDNGHISLGFLWALADSKLFPDNARGDH